MDISVYTEVVRKIQGEEVTLLQPLAVLEGYENEDEALEALVDAEPDLLGTEFVVFFEEPTYITVEPPPETKYSFRRRNGNTIAAEEAEAEVAYEDEPEEEVVVAVATKKRPAKKRPAAKTKPAAKKRPAAKRAPAGARAGTRTGSSKRTPFTKNPGSAE